MVYESAAAKTVCDECVGLYETEPEMNPDVRDSLS